MTDPSERSGSRWEPSESHEPDQQIEPDRPADPLVPPPPPAWHLPSTPSKRRPARLAIAAGALGVLAAGGLGGFVIGHATAGDGDGDESGLVDRDGALERDRGFPGTPPDFDGDGPGTPPDLDGDEDGLPSFPGQDQADPDSGTSNSSVGTGSAT